MNRELLQAHIETAGYQPLLANSGPKALELVQTQAVDLALVDVRMPGMNGYELCVHLRELPVAQNLPIILLTGLGDEETKLKALEVGADDFLTKPFDSLALLARIRTLLRIKHLQDELQRREAILWDVLRRHVDEDAAQRIMADLTQHT
jgi:DNA-binding response OmpR family regulator